MISPFVPDYKQATKACPALIITSIARVRKTGRGTEYVARAWRIISRRVICCQLYNNQKADRSVEEFRDFISNLTDVLDESKQYRLAIRYKKVVQVKPAPIKFYFENHK